MQCYISRVAYVLNDYLYSYILHNMGFTAYCYTSYTSIYVLAYT